MSLSNKLDQSDEGAVETGGVVKVDKGSEKANGERLEMKGRRGSPSEKSRN